MATIQEPVQNASVLCHEAKRWLLRFTRKLIRRRGGKSYGQLRRFIALRNVASWLTFLGHI